MRKECFLFVLLLFLSVACSKKSGVEHYEGEEVMKWKDEHLMQICRQVFDKPADHITYDDVSAIEEIRYVAVGNEGKTSVRLLNDSEAKLVDIPDSLIKTIEDLIYFKNLKYFEASEDNILGLEVLKDMPQLKTLVLEGVIDTKRLKKIAKYSHLESLTIPYHDIDYSCLSELSTLKTLILTPPYDRESSNFNALQNLPSEGFLLDLQFINYQRLIPELCTFFNTHTNISNLGCLYIPDGCDISFFKNMKNLEKVEIRGSSFDLTGISQMVWLKDLTIWGDNIDISKLSGLINLERLCIKEESGNIFPLSIDSLEDYKNLQSLSLQGYIIENLTGLEGYSNLTSFSCYEGLIEDISALKSLPNLEYLILPNNLITDITAIQFLTKLKYLDLYSNEISDISPLKNCINLECLKVNDNYIEDISPLKNLQKLEEIQIETNFHIEKDYYTEGDAELILWRNTLLSLPNLKYYVGGPPIGEYGEYGESDMDWISQHLPKVRYGYRDIGW